MSKFKIGDKVKILPRKHGEYDEGPGYNDDMVKFSGKSFVVSDINKSGRVELEGVSFLWGEASWMDHWLELAKPEFNPMPELKGGDWVTINRNGRTLFKFGDLLLIDGDKNVMKEVDPSEITSISRSNEGKIWEFKEEPKVLRLTLSDIANRFEVDAVEIIEEQ